MQFTGIFTITALLTAVAAVAQTTVGAAPKGDPKAVASRIIKYNFPTSCKAVTKAVRHEDGSIQATCSGTEYRVGTLFDASEGKVIEMSINCRKAKELLNVDC